MSKQLDFDAINKAALQRLPDLLKQWLPDGRLSGAYWVVKNPRRSDAEAGSFKIHMQTGKWGDFAIDAKGVGAISLGAYIFDVPAKQMAKNLADMLQGKSPMGGALQDTSSAKIFPVAEPKEWVPITPVLKDAPAAPQKHPKIGKASYCWAYKDARGELLCHVMRFDKFGTKQILPLTYCEHADGQREWRWQALPVPGPALWLGKFGSPARCARACCRR